MDRLGHRRQRLDTGHFDGCGCGSSSRNSRPWSGPSTSTSRAPPSPGSRCRGLPHHGCTPRRATATGSRVTLSVDQYGVIGELFARMTADLTNRYLRLEADGLKRRAEEAPGT